MNREENKTYIDPTISKTDFAGVLRVNQATQTQISSIVDVKNLFYRLNLLIIEVQETQDLIKDIDNRDFTHANTNFSAYSRHQYETIQSTLLEKQKLIHAANRTLLSNGIAHIARVYEIRLEKALEELKLQHRKEVDEIQDEISKISKKSINNRTETEKYNLLISKTAAVAKRAGFDLQVSFVFKKAALNESKSVSISDTLDKMHASVRSKEETIKLLQEKLKVDLQSLTYKLETERKEAEVKKPVCTPKSTKMKASRPTSQETIDFDKVQNEFKNEFDEQIKRFELQKKEELQINKESHDKFKLILMDLKNEVFKDAIKLDRVKVENIVPSADFFKVANILFPQNIKKRDSNS